MKKSKIVLSFLLMSCLAFMLSIGISSAAGSDNTTKVTRMPGSTMNGNNMHDSNTLGANHYNATSSTSGNFRTNAVDDNNDGFDWGWLGLLGLIGLAGLRSRNSDRNPERS